jgi:hypothetical protein
MAAFWQGPAKVTLETSRSLLGKLEGVCFLAWEGSDHTCHLPPLQGAGRPTYHSVEGAWGHWPACGALHGLPDQKVDMICLLSA